MRTSSESREERFQGLYAAAYEDLLHFAQRRVHPSHAEDVVAEAFLVAWRRIDDCPTAADDSRAWLFGIARNCLLNAKRGLGRQDALAVRIATMADSHHNLHPLDPAESAECLDLARAWQRLTPVDQEALALTVFDDLKSPHAARVLGISAAAYRLRLMRARRALRAQLGMPSEKSLTTVTIEETLS